MAGGAETPNIAALSAIAWLGACKSAQGPDADRHVKLLINLRWRGHSRALIHTSASSFEVRPPPQIRGGRASILVAYSSITTQYLWTTQSSCIPNSGEPPLTRAAGQFVKF